MRRSFARDYGSRDLRPIPCMLALRREGLAMRTAQCQRCGGGPCLDIEKKTPPNRLHGVSINEDGDAV